jgi:hypothetical protein
MCTTMQIHYQFYERKTKLAGLKKRKSTDMLEIALYTQRDCKNSVIV